MSRSETVVDAAGSGDRVRALEAMRSQLVFAIDEVSPAEVPALAERLVQVLRELGGSDPSDLLWLRHQLAWGIDRAAEVVGEVDEKGRPQGRELAPLVRQLTVVLGELERFDVAKEADPIDEIAAARAKRRGASGTADLSRSSAS